MTNVISPNSIKIRVLYSSDFWTDTPFLCVLCFSRVKYDSENLLNTSSLVHSPFPLNAILHPDWPKKEPISPPLRTELIFRGIKSHFIYCSLHRIYPLWLYLLSLLIQHDWTIQLHLMSTFIRFTFFNRSILYNRTNWIKKYYAKAFYIKQNKVLTAAYFCSIILW
jgi:hypothetical protein